MRRLPWIWLLPLLLLLGQVGQYRHGLVHYHQASQSTASGSQKQRPADADRCDSCLAYGHLSVAAASAQTLPWLRADLSFDHAPECPHAGADSALPAARNRGPPTA